MAYVKVRFTSKHGATAGLIFDRGILERMTISEVSRCFPYSEASKMHRFERSPEFKTWDEAFLYEFPESK